MQKRHIVRAERLSHTRLQRAVGDIIDAGFDVESWAMVENWPMGTVFVGNGRIVVSLEPGDMDSQQRIQELVRVHNGGGQVVITEEVDYAAVYRDLGIDIQN